MLSDNATMPVWQLKKTKDEVIQHTAFHTTAHRALGRLWLRKIEAVEKGDPAAIEDLRDFLTKNQSRLFDRAMEWNPAVATKLMRILGELDIPLSIKRLTE